MLNIEINLLFIIIFDRRRFRIVFDLNIIKIIDKIINKIAAREIIKN